MIADIVGVGVKTLREALAQVSKSGTQSRTTLAERIRRWVTGWPPKKKAWKSRWSRSSEMLAWLHRGIGLSEPAAEGKIR